MTTPRFVVPLAITLMLGADLTAQSAGPLVGTPATVLVGPGTASTGGRMANDVLHRKRAGFYGGWFPEAPTGAILDPVFSTTAMFGGGVATPAFTVNALSIGLDEVLATVPLGGISMVDVPPGAWGAVSLSVTRDSLGKPGSVLAAEVASSDGAGADIFSWMLPGSALNPAVLPCYPSDDLQRGLDSRELDLFGGGVPGEISAFDVYMPLYEVGPPIRALLPDRPYAFFSVDKASIFPGGGGGSLVPPAWFGGGAASSATILVTRWDTATLSWSPPTPFLTYVDLGLGVMDDIDALSVDLLRCKALFSIARTGTSTLAQQIQIVAWTCPDSPDLPRSYSGLVSVGNYSVPDGMGGVASVTSRMGLAANGDVDGTCTIDPGEQSGLGTVAYGTPVFTFTSYKPMWAQIFRDEAVVLPTLTTVVTGLPPGPTSPPVNVVMFVGFPLPGGGYSILPDAFYFEPLDGTNPSTVRTLPMPGPILTTFLGVSMDVLWAVLPGNPRPSASAMRIVL